MVIAHNILILIKEKYRQIINWFYDILKKIKDKSGICRIKNYISGV